MSISFDHVVGTYPDIHRIVSLVANVDDSTWATMKGRFPSMARMLDTLTILRTIFKNCVSTPGLEKKKNIDLSQIVRLQKDISAANKHLSSDGAEAETCNRFLEAINVPLATTVTGEPVTVKGHHVRFFPHPTSHSCKVKDCIGPAIEVAAATTLEDPENIKLSPLVPFKKFLVSKAPAAASDGKCLAELACMHTTRRSKCVLPVTDRPGIAGFLIESLGSESCTVEMLHGKLVLKAPCIGCTYDPDKKVTAALVEMPFAETCTFIQRTTGRNAVPVFKTALLMAAGRSKSLSRFSCPNAGCAKRGDPWIFELDYGCYHCVANRKEGKTTHFHALECPSCHDYACGLCSQPRSAHLGGTEVCPKEMVITEAEREEARKTDTFFCGACNIPCQRTAGCPHLRCQCGYHFCTLCEQELKWNEASGSYYLHDCAKRGQPGAGYFATAAEVAVHGIALPQGWAHDMNPDIRHVIREEHVRRGYPRGGYRMRGGFGDALDADWAAAENEAHGGAAHGGAGAAHGGAGAAHGGAGAAHGGAGGIDPLDLAAIEQLLEADLG